MRAPSIRLSANAVVPGNEIRIPMLVRDVLKSVNRVFKGTAVTHRRTGTAHNRMSVAGPLLLMT
jgi:hypothetical protein